MKPRHPSSAAQTNVLWPQKFLFAELARAYGAMTAGVVHGEPKPFEHSFNAESMMEGHFGHGNDHTETDFNTGAES